MRLHPNLALGVLGLLVCLTGTSIAAASGGAATARGPVSVSLPVTASDLRWTSAAGGVAPRLAGWNAAAEPGDPDLPARDVLVLLPPDTRPVAAEVTARATSAVAWEGRLAAAAGARTEDGAAVWDRLSSGGVQYPAAWGELVGTMTWHGFRCAVVRVYPLRVSRPTAASDWSAGELAGALDVAVTVADDAPSLRRERPVAGEQESVRAQLAARVANPALLAAYPQPAAAAQKSATAFAPTDTPSLMGSDVDLVIVTGAAMAGEFQRLADYRTARGVPSVVRTVEEIVAGYPAGADLQEKIRAFLRDAYQRWGTRFALLGGDVSVIPARMIFNTLYPSGGGTEIPVDLYYAGLDGNWNADGDETMGEPYMNGYNSGDDADLVAELWLGRLPVTTAAEAGVVVDKIIDYERDGVGKQYGRMLFLSEVLFPSAYAPGDTIVDDGAGYSEAIIDDVIGAAAESPAPARMYEAYDLWPGSYPERWSAVVDSLNSGNYGLVNHVGHGFFYNMSVGDRSLELKDASALRNGPHYFIVNSLNCASSAFDYNSILERLLLNASGGAVATIGLARAAFPGTAGEYQKEFYNALLLGGAQTIGAAIAASREPFDGDTSTNTPERWTHMTYTLLADPSMTVYTTAPTPLAVTAPATLALGGQSVNVHVAAAGAPLAGATVCLLKADEDYAYAVTGAAGDVALPFIAKSGGEAQLTVVAVNHQPYEAAVPISSAPAPYLKVSAVTCRDDGTSGSYGNGDGVPNPGETIALVCSLKNSGSLATGATPWSAWSEDPQITVLSGATTVPPLAPGAVAAGAAVVLAQVAASAADAHHFTVQVVGVDQGRYYLDELPGEIHAPLLEPNQLVWSDYPSGDGDGTLETNENIAVRFTLFNLGSGRASGLTGTVTTANANVTVVDGAGAWPDAAPLGAVEPNDEFVVRLAAINNDTEATLTLQDAYGHTWTHRFDLKAPTQPVITSLSSPGGGEALIHWEAGAADPDQYGYHVYRSTTPNSGYVRLTVEPVLGSTFFLDTGLAPLTRYYYQVAAVDSSRMFSRNSSTGSISTTPPEAAGFPIGLAVESSSHCAVGDVNGDGVMDVVMGAECLYVWDADGVELRDGDGDPQTLGPFNNVFGDWGPAGIVLANLTSRPGMEIVASYRTGRQIYVYQGDGSVAPGWPRTMSSWNWATPAVGDLDGNGDLEIVATTVDGRTYVWNHDGTDFFDGDGNPATIGVFQVRSAENYSLSSPALADLDGDGGAEIIFGTRYRDTTNIDYVHALKSNGTEAAGWPFSLGLYGEVVCSPAVADVDQDGSLEVVFVSENDRLHVVNANGTEQSPFPKVFVSNCSSAGISCPSPALADFDGDGNLEIVAVSTVTTDSAAVYVMNISGANLTGWPRPVVGNSESSPVVADITGDGKLDVLFGVGGGDDTSPNYLYGFRHNGGTVPGFPLVLTGPIRPAPFLTDLDGDGGIDIVYGGWDLAMHVWDLPAPYSATAVPWPTFKGNPLRTGLYRQAWVTAAGDWELLAGRGGAGVLLRLAGDSRSLEAGPWSIERARLTEAGTVRLQAEGGGATPVAESTPKPPVWETLGRAAPEGGDVWTFEDSSAGEGESYRYRARSASSGRVVVSSLVSLAPARAVLDPNRPNPCNPRTRLTFSLPAGPARQVRLTLYDVRGRRVRRLVERELGAGRYEVDWQGDDDRGQSVASGVYLYRLEAGSDSVQRKLLLLR